jgi:hypothetical protein
MTRYIHLAPLPYRHSYSRLSEPGLTEFQPSPDELLGLESRPNDRRDGPKDRRNGSLRESGRVCRAVFCRGLVGITEIATPLFNAFLNDCPCSHFISRLLSASRARLQLSRIPMADARIMTDQAVSSSAVKVLKTPTPPPIILLDSSGSSFIG